MWWQSKLRAFCHIERKYISVRIVQTRVTYSGFADIHMYTHIHCIYYKFTFRMLTYLHSAFVDIYAPSQFGSFSNFIIHSPPPPTGRAFPHLVSSAFTRCSTVCSHFQVQHLKPHIHPDAPHILLNNISLPIASVFITPHSTLARVWNARTNSSLRHFCCRMIWSITKFPGPHVVRAKQIRNKWRIYMLNGYCALCLVVSVCLSVHVLHAHAIAKCAFRCCIKYIYIYSQSAQLFSVFPIEDKRAQVFGWNRRLVVCTIWSVCILKVYMIK